MIGLWGRKDMEELETNLYLRKGSARADFETLGVYDQELERLPNKHAAIDFLKFDVHSLGDESYKEFRCEQASMAALTADAAPTRGAAGETTPTAAIVRSTRGASGQTPTAASAAPRGASGKPPSAATALAAPGLHPGCCENLEADWATLAIKSDVAVTKYPGDGVQDEVAVLCDGLVGDLSLGSGPVPNGAEKLSRRQRRLRAAEAAAAMLQPHSPAKCSPTLREQLLQADVAQSTAWAAFVEANAVLELAEAEVRAQRAAVR